MLKMHGTNCWFLHQHRAYECQLLAIKKDGTLGAERIFEKRLKVELYLPKQQFCIEKKKCPKGLKKNLMKVPKIPLWWEPFLSNLLLIAQGRSSFFLIKKKLILKTPCLNTSQVPYRKCWAKPQHELKKVLIILHALFSFDNFSIVNLIGRVICSSLCLMK